MKVDRSAIVGSGTMGTGIAQKLAIAGYGVTLTDLRNEALESAIVAIDEGPFGLRRAVERGKLDREAAEAARSRIQTTTDVAEACAGADVVVEAVSEDFALKIEVLDRIDQDLAAHGIIASNSSGFSMTALATATSRPEKMIGWHWAAPAQVMKLAEIVVHPQCSDDTRDTVVEMARRCGNNPEVIRDDPFTYGLVTTRAFLALARETDAIVAEGVATRVQVDQLLKDCFRWPHGPFEIRHGVRSRD